KRYGDSMIRFPVVLLMVIILLAGAAGAQPDGQVVINSAEWVDVYSAIMYANFKGMPYNFVISEPHARVMTRYMDKNRDIRVIESDSVPYLVNYKGTLESSGYRVVEDTRSSGGKALNLKLAGELDIDNFIVVNDQYGYNAISAASYAVKSKSWVLIADRVNIDEVYGFLKERNAKKILIYGYVDRKVKEKLAEFNPEIIDKGNRFDDNLAIVRKYMELTPSEEAILTNGDFIEATIMSGQSPVIFIGAQTVPLQVIDYVKNSGIKGSTLIGNDLTNSGRVLKEAAGITIFIKFGQGRQVSGDFSLVEELDRFYLPRYELTLDVVSAQYNAATKKLEVIYRNGAKIGEFYKSSIGVLSNGERIVTVGDDAAQYIEAESDAGQAYDVDLTEYVRNGGITAQVTSEFGEAPNTLNMLLSKTVDVSIVSVEDISQIEVSGIKYNTNTKRIELTIINTGTVPCYVSPSVKVLIEGDEENLRLGNALPTGEGNKITPSLRVELTDADLADNPDVQIHLAYGERPNLLIKSLDTKQTLQVSRGIPLEIVLVAVISLIIILISVVVVQRRRKTTTKSVKCPECGKTLHTGARFCPSCGTEVK
ncbi:MAG: zinc ribbon domain-containing protein, partial [Methanosarcinales archaeon]